MIYLLYGEEQFLIDKEIEKITTKEKIDSISISHYDLEIDNIKDIIDDCSTISLFEEKKLVIINNCTYFNRVKNSEEDVNLLLEYISNPNPSTILIIINHNSSIDNTKKISKKIKEIGTIIELNSSNINSIVKNMFEGYKIKEETINLFIKRVGEDISILSMESDKLKTYKIDEKEITNEDIMKCATFNIDTDIFKFIDNIISKKKEDALITYHELLRNNEEPLKIIVLLASKFRLMYQASIMSQNRMSDKDIGAYLGVHPYPVKLAKEACNKYSKKTVLRFLELLADLDKDIKTGKVNPELGLELFILKV